MGKTETLQPMVQEHGFPPSSRPVSSRRLSTARSKSRGSSVASRLSSRGELLANGCKVPTINLPDRPRTGVSSALSGYTDESARMDELSKVKAELEQALQQVKAEMREGGASKSQLGSSTVRSRSVMSDISGISGFTSSTVNWDMDAEIAKVNKGDRTSQHPGVEPR